MCRFLIRSDGNNFPERGCRQFAVERDAVRLQAYAAKPAVERVLLPLAQNPVVGHAVRPWREKGNAARAGALPELTRIGGRRVEDVLAMNLHGISVIAESGDDGDFHAMRTVGQANDVAS